MYKTALEILFISEWHIGSGLGNGAIADAILCRDAAGIPIIPGTAIKGALREGAWRLGICSDNYKPLPDFMFGTASNAHISNQPGILSIGMGMLDKNLRDWLLSRGDFADFIEDMTVVRQQTRLDANKIVENGSLRSIECGIPGLVFSTTLDADLPETLWGWFADYLAAICACVKSIGGYRARGIGRCRISIPGKKAVELPGPVPQELKALMKKRKTE